MTKEQIEQAYGVYWDFVKDLVDSEGWVESLKVPHLFDFYFEKNTGKDTEFQKGGSSPTGHSRWRPAELKNL